MAVALELWLVDLDRDGGQLAEIALHRSVMSPADRERHAGYRNASDAEAFAATRGALDLVLETHGAKAGTPLRITRSGKPFVPGLPGFSMSRTRGHAAIVVSPKGAVGVDIERRRTIAATEPLVGHVARLAGDRSGSLDPLAAWTIVEAWSKRRGIMLATLLDSPALQRELQSEFAGHAAGLLPLPLPAELVGHCSHEAGNAVLVQKNIALPA
jgi:4'-phosphopantetheinyl transferase